MLKRALRLHSLVEKRREALGAKNRAFVPPYFIGICGGTGSDKEIFCHRVAEVLGEKSVLILREQDYCHENLPVSVSAEATDFEHPDAVDFELLKEQLEALNNGCAIGVPRYDFRTRRRQKCFKVEHPVPFVVVEGTTLFTQTHLAAFFSQKVFIDTPESARNANLASQDWYNRRSKGGVDIGLCHSSMQVLHSTYVEPCKARADLVISGDDPFEPAIAVLCMEIVHSLAGSTAHSFVK